MIAKKILVIGAGLSSSYLIKYVCDEAGKNNWQITIADSDKQLAETKIKGKNHATAISLDVNDSFELNEVIAAHDLVISLLPPSMHIGVAKTCIKNKKHLITASYISPEMHHLHVEALKANIILLNECGLDPGIDHLSAMQLIHRIQHHGGTIQSFKSFCGGLVAPEFDDNPWNYKFTWNPRNVVLAGQATAKYLEQKELKFIPASRIFTQTEPIQVAGYGDFESYANRDSLGYIKPYGIESAHTVLRGTLRRKGYSKAWNMLVKMGLTDDTFVIENASKLTYRDFVSAFVPETGLDNLETRVCRFLEIESTSEEFKKLQWLGLFEEEKIKLNEGTPAQILQWLLQQKWKLHKGELDMIVMHHELKYAIKNENHILQSSLVVKGEDEIHTAMAKTVGLPMGIAAKLILSGKIKSTGVVMPVHAEFYEPILEELKQFGVEFTETLA